MYICMHVCMYIHVHLIQVPKMPINTFMYDYYIIENVGTYELSIVILQSSNTHNYPLTLCAPTLIHGMITIVVLRTP